MEPETLEALAILAVEVEDEVASEAALVSTTTPDHLSAEVGPTPMSVTEDMSCSRSSECST